MTSSSASRGEPLAEAGGRLAASGEPTPAPADEQLVLVPAAVRAAARRRPARAVAGPAVVDPVARVVLDVPLAHLDREFEYAVPEPMSADAQPGVRVRVRFAGQEREGYVVARGAVAEHVGALTPLRRVVSAEPVLSADLLRLCRTVADRWAGSLSDVLRLAVPPRHAEAERVVPRPGPVDRPPSRPEPGPWAGYPAGSAFLDRLAAGGEPRAAWTALSDAGDGPRGWPGAIAVAALTTVSAGRGALVVVPDARDVERVVAAVLARSGGAAVEVLSADLGPRARYAAWLRVRRGVSRLVVGTRAAMFAPIHDLGLVVCWDDGDDLHAEPHAPYPHVREVLALRAGLEGAAVLLGAHARTAEVQQMVEVGWARSLEAPQAVARAAAPRVLVSGEGHEPERDPAAASARLPSLAWRTARAALATAPVLVQVPRRGYLLSLACRTCRAAARCPACHGPLALLSSHAVPSCRWCGKPAGAWVCTDCGDTRMRSQVVGAGRTAEELGRAFAGVPVVTSGGTDVVARVPARPALVVATPGAEPVAEGGYGAVLLLDAWALLGRSDLAAGQEALRRWANACALVRPASDGGVAVLVGPGGLPPVEALVRWDPTWHAERELAERRALAFPPATTVITLTGARGAVDDLAAATALPGDVELLGPVPLPTRSPGGGGPGRGSGVRPGSGPGGGPADDEPVVRLLLRASLDRREQLAAAVRAGVAVRSARKAPGAVRVQVDPLDLV